MSFKIKGFSPNIQAFIMSKILLITYTPRFDSKTAMLVQTFLDHCSSPSNIIHLDLVKNPPPLLLSDNLNAILKRNFMGLELNQAETNAAEGADQLTQQLLDADKVVLAFPMYNFSVPATVKAWIDAVVQNGKTFTITEDGSYEGLCHAKKALILMTTGSDMSQEPMKSMDFAMPLASSILGFMGIESHGIVAYGLNQYIDRIDEIVNNAQQETITFLNENPSW